MRFRAFALRRHLPIRLRRWGFERSPFVVILRLDYEDYVSSVSPSPFALTKDWPAKWNVSLALSSEWKFNLSRLIWYQILVFHLPTNTALWFLWKLTFHQIDGRLFLFCVFVVVVFFFVYRGVSRKSRKVILKTPTRLFCKAGRFIYCKGNKN